MYFLGNEPSPCSRDAVRSLGAGRGGGPGAVPALRGRGAGWQQIFVGRAEAGPGAGAVPVPFPLPPPRCPAPLLPFFQERESLPKR